MLHDVCDSTGAPVSIIYLRDPEALGITRVAMVGGDSEMLPEWLPDGVGLAGLSARGEVIVSGDALRDSRVSYPILLNLGGIRSSLFVPLRDGDEIIGTLGAGHAAPSYFNATHVDQVTLAASHISAAITTGNHDGSSDSLLPDYRTLYRRRFRRVRELSARVYNLHHLDAIFDHALRVMAELARARVVLLSLVDSDGGSIRATRGYGIDPGTVKKITSPVSLVPSDFEDVFATVVRTGTPQWLAPTSPRSQADSAHLVLGECLLVVPLINSTGTLGTLAAGWDRDATSDPELLDIALILADHVAAAIDAQRAVDAERHQRLVAEQLHAVAQQITAEISLDNTLSAVLETIRKLFEPTASSIWLTTTKNNIRHYLTVSSTGEMDWHQADRDLSSDEPFATVARQKEAILLNDAPTDGCATTLEGARAQSRVGVPVRHGDYLLGMLFVEWHEHCPCSTTDLHLLGTLAAYSAVGVINAGLQARDIKAARIDGVILAAHTVVHQINNDLALTMGMAELARLHLSRDLPTDPTIFDDVVNGAERIAQHVRQLRGVVRIEEERERDQPALLDLDRSSETLDG